MPSLNSREWKDHSGIRKFYAAAARKPPERWAGICAINLSAEAIRIWIISLRITVSGKYKNALRKNYGQI